MTRAIVNEALQSTETSKIHRFELAKLGKAPFHFTGTVTEKVFVACPGATPKAGSSCDYCGTSIRYEFWVRSSDAKEFKVGCDCIHKTGDRGLIQQISAAERKLRDVKNAAAKARKIERLNARLEAALKILPFSILQTLTGKRCSTMCSGALKIVRTKRPSSSSNKPRKIPKENHMAISSIRMRHGTEGPTWDPYAYTVIHVCFDNNKEVEFRSGLADRCTVTHDDLKTFDGLGRGLDTALKCRRKDKAELEMTARCDDAARLFEAASGLTLAQATKIIDRLENPRKCKCGSKQFTFEDGYPGETFQICRKCREIVASSFNESAIL